MKTKCLFLVLLAMLMTASACSTTQSGTENSSDPTDSNTPDVQETEIEIETELMDAVPEELKFGGADFKFLSADSYGAASLVDGETGEVYNDAIYKTELYTEERLDVDISEELYSAWEIQAQARTLVSSGDTTYDTISMTDRDSASLTMEGIFYPMEKIPYVDLSKKYWGDGFMKDLSIGGRAFFAISSFNLYSIERTTFILFNEAVAQKHDLEVPFDAVFDGTWTFDMLEIYENIATYDVDGNGVMDDKDSYTYGCVDARDIEMKFMYAAGCKWVDVGTDGIPYVSCYGNERVVDSLEWARDYFVTGNNNLPDRESHSKKFGDVNALYEMFVDDRELLNVSEFRRMSFFREMESDFSILPMPKYDVTQDRYYSYTSNLIFSMVPTTATDLEKAGAVQEVMCCEGYKTILPAYIDSYLTSKLARNQESGEAIKLIYDTRAYDLGKLYIYDHLGGAVHDSMKTGNSVVPFLENQRNIMESSLQNIIEAYTALKG